MFLGFVRWEVGCVYLWVGVCGVIFGILETVLKLKRGRSVIGEKPLH
jgi:hypothetical protein